MDELEIGDIVQCIDAYGLASLQYAYFEVVSVSPGAGVALVTAVHADGESGVGSFYYSIDRLGKRG